MAHLLTIDQHLSVMKDVLKKEAEAINRLIERMDGEMLRVIEMMLNCNGRVVMTGVGKSGIIAHKISATFASTGTPSLFLHPAEGLHGDLGMVTKDDVVFALSKSGESDELIQIIPSIKKIGAKLIALVSNDQSTLARQADEMICIGQVEEACPLGVAPTTSTTLMLALGDAIAMALLTARQFSLNDFAIYHPGGLLGKRLLVTVDSIIEHTKRNPCIYPTATIKDAIFKMTESNLGATSIIDKNGQLIGILTDGDIRRALVKEENILNMSIEYIYNHQVISIEGKTLAYEALHLMQQKNINVLPVVNEQNIPVGMIHLHDITKLGF